MYGVVLWSDSKRAKALIWCEDHQNLAFFRGDREADAAARFGPGDLVEFDLHEENELRLAVDPCVVAPHEFPALAAQLKSAGAGLERDAMQMPRGTPDGSAGPGRAGRGAKVVALYPGDDAEPGTLPARAYG